MAVVILKASEYTKADRLAIRGYLLQVLPDETRIVTVSDSYLSIPYS